MELVRRLQSNEPSGKRRATCLMSLVKHGYVVLLVDQEDDFFVVGGVDNAIILYRTIEKDGTGSREEKERKDILWSLNDPWTMTFLRTDDINRLTHELDKEQEKTVLSVRSTTSDSFVVSFAFFVFAGFCGRVKEEKKKATVVKYILRNIQYTVGY